jgi:ketosteroid isomerase-like protein
MRRISITVSVAVLVFAVAVQAQPLAQTKSGGVEQELIKLEKEWSEALIKRDVAFLDRIFADDYIGTDSDGNVLTRTQDMASLKSGDYLIISTVLDDIKVHVYGDVAVYFGRSTDKAQFKGKDVTGQYRWTDTWVKLAGHWQCVASHGSRIAKKWKIGDER